ncbi:hypothetical protein DPMN_014750 [Dreissena polymorpha]|uniref:Uncharacterized protein n=1 Tax=Dreissena polymorpha TaxID=45954 RepID=A0A9D4NA91_DREPO|nr:hypothetical protein DPMN_014750 [Dreissena polymorpha]
MPYASVQFTLARAKQMLHHGWHCVQFIDPSGWEQGKQAATVNTNAFIKRTTLCRTIDCAITYQKDM